jgi:two-component system chemotaxis sensor kinase CheA
VDANTLARQLMPTYLEELHDHIQALNNNLLALEKESLQQDERLEELQSILRTVHSLKGASRSMNMDLIESVCHHLEDVIAGIRDNCIDLDESLFVLLFKTADGIDEAGKRLGREQTLDDSVLLLLDQALELAASANQLETTVGTISTPGNLSELSSQPLSKSHPDSTMIQASVPAAASDYISEPCSGDPSTKPVSTLAADKQHGTPLKTSTTLRIHAEKLDSLLTQSGELLVAHRRVESRLADITSLRESVAMWRAEWREVERPLRRFAYAGRQNAGDPLGPTALTLSHRTRTILERMSDHLMSLEKSLERLTATTSADNRVLATTCEAVNADVHRARMLPFADACNGLERVVRDLAVRTGKHAKLVIEGEEVELDRSILEGIRDPLLHLVRNAVDHGIESPDERLAASKSPEATIKVAAALRGSRVEVTVSDDGRGLDLVRIREKVAKKGLPQPHDDRELARAIFLPGFSTATMVTDVSGRGVGLDVVQKQIDSLHGIVDLSFETGRGTQFTLTVPLTLTTIRCILMEVAEQAYALATANVRQIIRFCPDQMRSIGGRNVFMLGDAPVPIVDLCEILGLSGLTKRPSQSNLTAVIVSASDHKIGFVVDNVLAEQEVLVKTLGPRMRRLRHVCGASLLPSRHVAPVLNATSLVRAALGRASTQPLEQPLSNTKEHSHLLVVEDCLTTRTLMKSILENSSYHVTTAVDGKDAWKRLSTSKVDLVVSDVDMPGMNGFELASAIRKSPTYQSLPVILVTARETDEDKARGVQSGANAYLVKSGFDQQHLLETIQQLL